MCVFRWLNPLLFFVLSMYSGPLFSVYSFQEIWAYCLRGEEKFFRKGMPITDLVYFSAAVNELGSLEHVPERCFSLPRGHLAISTPYNRSLTHWILARDPETKENLVREIVAASGPFEGVNIDFEAVLPQDRDAFLCFLSELRKRLPKEKVFSVTVPARSSVRDDAFPYSRIAEIADKVFVMAYDQNTKDPGEIASLDWCTKIGAFAKTQIPIEKVIMGIPLYGRVWQQQVVSRALKYPQTLELLRQFPKTVLKRTEDGTGFFSFQQVIDATAYFEDMHSLGGKMGAYQKSGFKSVGFWRLSQEPAALWENVRIDKPSRSE